MTPDKGAIAAIGIVLASLDPVRLRQPQDLDTKIRFAQEDADATGAMVGVWERVEDGHLCLGAVEAPCEGWRCRHIAFPAATLNPASRWPRVWVSHPLALDSMSEDQLDQFELSLMRQEAVTLAAEPEFLEMEF